MKFRPMKNEVLLKHIPEREIHSSLIYFKDDPSNNTVQHFKVLAVGHKCTELKIGDVVLCSWRDMTPPFDFDGEQVAVAPEDRIQAVVE